MAYAFDGLNDDGTARVKEIGACETYNCGRGAARTQFNLRGSKTFMVKNMRIEAIVEVFNLFNALNPNNFNPTRLLGTGAREHGLHAAARVLGRLPEPGTARRPGRLPRLVLVPVPHRPPPPGGGPFVYGASWSQSSRQGDVELWPAGFGLAGSFSVHCLVMMRRRTIAVALLASACMLIASGCGGGSARGASARRSAGGGAAAKVDAVVLITIDTLRADRVGAYGWRAARTPAIDALAARGVRAERAYATAPITLPSHASLLTGVYPSRHGARHNGMRVKANVPTLAEMLRARGFATGAFIAAFPLDRRFGLDRGFDVYGDTLPRGADGRPRNERSGQAVVDEALAWVAKTNASGASGGSDERARSRARMRPAESRSSCGSTCSNRTRRTKPTRRWAWAGIRPSAAA